VIRVAPNGDLFVAESMLGTVQVLRNPSGGGSVRHELFASGLKQPFGIAFYPVGGNPSWVYIANRDGVVRFRYKNGDLKASGKSEHIVEGIPTTHYVARDFAFSTEGKRLLLSVGSGSVAAARDTKELATGMRNCESMTVEPETGELRCIVDERDELGAGQPLALGMAVGR
jgi:glucose/arabinose dehydrogenase